MISAANRSARRRRALGDPRGRAAGLFLAIAAIGIGQEAWAGRLPRAFVVDDGARIRRDDLRSPLARGENNAIWRPGAPIHLRALRDEVVAFQVVVEAGESPLSQVSVDVDVPGAIVDRFVEHYVNVTQRSHNARRPEESLGWAPDARPRDEDHTGPLPDALLPVEIAPSFSPYPLAILARSNGAVWVDITVPRDAPAGLSHGAVVVADSAGPIARIPIDLEVGTSVLPYRAVSFLAYYNYGTIAARIGNAEVAERQLIQLLHQHHIDALASLSRVEDADRLRPALDGSLFTGAFDYRGPGVGIAPEAVALGAYGGLDEPTPDKIATVEAIVPRIPPSVGEVILYASDEDCDSPTGPGWRRLIRRSTVSRRVRVAQACSDDPRRQDVDLVLMPAEDLSTESALSARRDGQEVWVYNGALPRAGTLLLDADPVGLRANGWIAASHDVGRWFLWETTFWNDDNRGGKGPIDPFVTAESFHNRQGDSALGDGMLLYPGTELGPFAAHSLGFPGVLPSIRLKNLRRGIEDAGYVALAREAAPEKADAVVAGLIPAVLDELSARAESEIPEGGARFAAAREALRALIPAGAQQTAEETRGVLAAAASQRRAVVVAERRARMERRIWVGGIAMLGPVIAALLVRWRLRRRAGRAPLPSEAPPPGACGPLPDSRSYRSLRAR